MEHFANPSVLVYHELRGPLALLATAARSAAEDCEQDGVRSRLETILRATERMLRTSEQMIALAGSRDAQPPQVVVPADLAEQVVGDLRGLGADLRFTARPGARKATRRLVLAQLEALLASLVNNARDHGDPSEPIDVVAEAVAKEIVISVSNARGGNTRHRGIGLGSRICDALAGELGLTVEYREEGKLFQAIVRIPASADRHRSAQHISEPTNGDDDGAVPSYGRNLATDTEHGGPYTARPRRRPISKNIPKRSPGNRRSAMVDERY